MLVNDFQASPLAKHVADIITLHYNVLSAAIQPNQKDSQPVLFYSKIEEFIQNMNDASIKRSYSQGNNIEAVNGALVKQSVFPVNLHRYKKKSG